MYFLRLLKPDSRKEWAGFFVSTSIITISFFVLMVRIGARKTPWLAISTSEWMDILYLPLAVSLAITGVITLVYWYRVRRASMVLMAGMMHLSNSLSILVLSSTTGDHPRLPISDAREFIVYSRFALFIFSNLCTIAVIKMLTRYDKHATLIEVPKVSISEDSPNDSV